MTYKHDMTAPKMTRVTVRVPKTTLDQINDWVDTLGVRRSHFLGIALVAGVRTLIQASALTPDADALPIQEDAQSNHVSAAEQPSPNTKEGNRAVLAETIAGLQTQVASMQAQITELKDQLQTRRMAEKKRS